MLTAQIVFPQPAGIPGGTQTHVSQLISDLCDYEGIRSVVVSGRSTRYTRRIIKLADVCELFDTGDSISLTRVCRALHWLKNQRPTVIHSHGYEANWFALLARRRRWSLGTAVPWVATIHGWLENSRKEVFKAFLDRLSLLWADGVIAVAPGQLEQCHLRRDTLRRVIPNGVDVKYFATMGRSSSSRENRRSEWQIPTDAFAIGTAGRLSPEKAHDVFFRVARRMSREEQNAWFVIAGDGEERASIEAYVRSTGLGCRARLVGTLEDMAGFYSSLDLFLLTSRVEGTPRVLLEAMAAGLPVVSTSVGGVRTLLPADLHKYTLAPSDNVEALTRQVCRLMESPSLRLELGRALSNYVGENFSSRSKARQIGRFYSTVLERR